MKKAYYVAELNLPTNSAYAHHVLKMCDALSENFDTTLIIFENNISFASLKKKYLLKKNFKIVPFNQNIFCKRILFGLFVVSKVEKKSLIISRSPMASMILAFFNFRLFFEVHHTFFGLTHLFFNFIKKTAYFKNFYFIFINKSLCKYLNINNRYVVLDDAVDIRDFKSNFKNKIKYDFTYTGSLFKGKGLDVIYYLSKKFTKYKFHIFGDSSKIDEHKYQNNNLIFHGFKNYNQIVKILRQSRYLLMPYANKVYVNSKNVEISKFISPLKLFDYMASKKIIFASRLKAYQHITIHNKNCILIPPDNLNLWEKALKRINLINEKTIIKNSYNMVLNFTWKNRIDKIKIIYQNLSQN